MSKKSGVALLSVYDKTGIVEFAEELANMGWEIYASGGTAKAITYAGITVKDVSELVGGSAILGHRVVTLSREISAGLLADKNSFSDIKELKELGIPIIDLVCVDMYPLEETINKSGKKSDVIKQTDIGGPTMLRAAAKAHRIVLSHVEQRKTVIDWLKNGRPNEEEFIERLAARAEYEVAKYVFTSAKYLNSTEISGNLSRKSNPTKYGENPQQTEAAFYADNRVNPDPLGIDQFQHVQGMERSYINMTDIDRLLQTVTHIAAGFDVNFKSIPSIAVGVKHGNACGAGVADNHVQAIQKMIKGDTRAIFGGVIMINGPVNKEVAETLMKYEMPDGRSRLLDGVIGSSVTDDALELLSRNKLRVIINPSLDKLDKNSMDKSRRQRPVRGGILEQPNYDFVIDLGAKYMEFYGELTDSQKKDLILGWAIGCTSNSNTITIVKDGQLLGNGVGQQDRVGAGQLALTRTSNLLPELVNKDDKIILIVMLEKSKIEGSVAYSDSFFPFPDGPELLAKAGVKVFLTSSGSVGDESVIKVLTDLGASIAMLPDKIGRGFYLH